MLRGLEAGPGRKLTNSTPSVLVLLEGQSRHKGVAILLVEQPV